MCFECCIVISKIIEYIILYLLYIQLCCPNDGELTVLTKMNKQSVTIGDLNISKKYNGILTDIIIDGKIMYENLKNTNKNEQWLKEQLKTNNIFNEDEVFYAGLNDAGIFYISKKLNDKEKY